MCYRLSDRFKNFFLSKERAIFRFDPVPGTGKKNWCFGHFYKTACCMQERRLYGDLDHRKYSRGKRYPSNLPDAWDDWPKSRTYNKRSWKKTKKKKQWMKKEVNMISFSPNDNPVNPQDKKLNYNMSKTKVKSMDYTRPATGASQTDDDDLRIKAVEEEYEVPENRKNPERNYGALGIRIKHDTFADTGLPPEGVKVLEEDTAVANDDAKKHGPLNKWQYSGGLEGKTGPE